VVVKVKAERVRALLILTLLLAGMLTITLHVQPVKAQPENTTVTVDGSVTYQTIDGFGGAGAFYQNYLDGLQEPARTQVANLLFTDLGTSIYRLRVWTGIEPSNGTFDFNNTDPDQVWTATQAKDRGVTQFMASVWTPPAWMKSNGQETNGGYLNRSMYQAFANYLAAYVKGYQQYHNITISYISIQNEPEENTTYQSCLYNATQMRDVVKVVGATFAAENITTKIVIPETAVLSDAPDYISTIMADPNASKYVDVFASHIYDIPFFDPDAGISSLQTVAGLGTQYNEPIWQTEYSYLQTSGANTFQEALCTAEQIHNVLTYENGSAYLVWALFWTNDGTGQGLITIPSDGASTYTVTPKFYAAKQYFKFIRPGSKRIEAACNNPDILASAYMNEANGNVTIVAINNGSSSITTTFNLKNVSSNSFKQYQTSASENCAYIGNILVRNNSFNVNLPAESVTTFISTVPLEHELAVSLEAPSYLEPGETSLLNATVYNSGLNNEAAELSLMIDGTVVNSTSISNLVSGTSCTISHLWAPTHLGTYNVTAYAPPVSGENYTYNHRATILVVVTYPLIHPMEGQWAEYNFSAEFSGATYTSQWNFTYDHYISPQLINVTIEAINFFEPTGWIVVNTMNGLVESSGGAGSLFAGTGTWYSGWIETNITLGSTVNLMSGVATVIGNRILNFSRRLIDCWELAQQSGGFSYTYWYDKGTGLVINEKWTGSFSLKMTLIATNIPVGAAGLPDVAVLSVTPSLTEITVGENVAITVVVKNNGTAAETFNVTAYYNTIAIGMQTVTNLAAGANTTLTFIWDTKGVAVGSYTIKADAPLTGDISPGDNEYTYGQVAVKEPFSFGLWMWITIAAVIAVIAVAAAFLLTRKKPI
jgi:glucuronoarabinoxylan endo-1,4-beta-xylanase